MAIIPLPDNDFRSIDWRLEIPQQINRSTFTGRRKVVGLPGAARWRFSANHVPFVSEADLRPWRAFFAQLDGVANSFRMIAAERAQRTGSNPVAAAGASAGAVQITLSGLPASATALPAGAMMTLPLTGGDEQLVILTAALTANGSGQAVASFRPELRGAVAASAIVETILPWALVTLDEPVTGWTSDPDARNPNPLVGSEAF